MKEKSTSQEAVRLERRKGITFNLIVRKVSFNGDQVRFSEDHGLHSTDAPHVLIPSRMNAGDLTTPV